MHTHMHTRTPKHQSLEHIPTGAVSGRTVRALVVVVVMVAVVMVVKVSESIPR